MNKEELVNFASDIWDAVDGNIHSYQAIKIAQYLDEKGYRRQSAPWLDAPDGPGWWWQIWINQEGKETRRLAYCLAIEEIQDIGPRSGIHWQRIPEPTLPEITAQEKKDV